MPRKFIDALLFVALLLPVAAANAFTDALDLGVTDLSEGQVIEARITVDALPNLVAAKTVTVKLLDSDDGVNFTAIEELSPIVITGAVGNGAAAVEQYVYLPRSTRRYVRLEADVLAAAGDNTASKFGLALQPVS